MALSDYFRLLRRWGWLLVLMAVLTAASAYVFSKLQTPVYKSTIYIGVQPTRLDLGLTQSAKTMLRYYVAVIDSDVYAGKVIDVLQLDRTPAALRGDVTIASDESRFVLQIDVKATDGDQANDIAQKWADAFVQWRNTENAKVRREDRVDALILDAPKYTLDQPKTSVNVLAGAILGFLLGGVVLFVIEYLEAGVLRSAADVERALSLPVLGAIPTGEAQPKRR